MNNDIKNQFIVDDEQLKQNIDDLVKKALKYAKITKNGDIIIEEQNLSQDNKLKLCLVIRFLANSLEETISDVVRPIDLTRTMGERVESVGSRLSILAKQGFAKKVGYGQYRVQPYKIEKFFVEIEENTNLNRSEGSGELNHTSVRKKHSRSTSGVGTDVQDLIDDGFFTTPKFISEVKKKLEEEVKYHDIRVIDMTIRKTFVGSKKLLKRIPNDGKGGAKWKYVIR